MPKLTSKRLRSLKKEIYAKCRISEEEYEYEAGFELSRNLLRAYIALNNAYEILRDMEQEDGHTT